LRKGLLVGHQFSQVLERVDRLAGETGDDITDFEPGSRGGAIGVNLSHLAPLGPSLASNPQHRPGADRFGATEAVPPTFGGGKSIPRFMIRGDGDVEVVRDPPADAAVDADDFPLHVEEGAPRVATD
jgi:hypothetical protein